MTEVVLETLLALRRELTKHFGTYDVPAALGDSALLNGDTFVMVYPGKRPSSKYILGVLAGTDAKRVIILSRCMPATTDLHTTRASNPGIELHFWTIDSVATPATRATPVHAPTADPGVRLPLIHENDPALRPLILRGRAAPGTCVSVGDNETRRVSSL